MIIDAPPCRSSNTALFFIVFLALLAFTVTAIGAFCFFVWWDEREDAKEFRAWLDAPAHSDEW